MPLYYTAMGHLTLEWYNDEAIHNALAVPNSSILLPLYQQWHKVPKPSSLILNRTHLDMTRLARSGSLWLAPWTLLHH